MCGATPHSCPHRAPRARRVTVSTAPGAITKSRFASGSTRARFATGALGVVEVGGGPIADLAPCREVVVHLHDDPGARREVDARARRKRRAAPSRAPTRQSWAARRCPIPGRSPRSRSSRCPGSAASFACAAASCACATANSSTWCTLAGVPGWTWKPIEIARRGQPRIDQEAAIIVARGQVPPDRKPPDRGWRRRPEVARVGAGGGASVGLPAGAPASAQVSKVAISAADRRRDPWKSPHPSAGGQGGISPARVAAARTPARGCASS